MTVLEFLKENKSSMRLGLPIELQDLIDERTVYDGSYEGMVEFLDKPGLEHVRSARFIMEDMDNGQNKIVLLYIKDIKEYDDFDLRQFAAKMKRMERYEATLEGRIDDATQRSEASRGESGQREVEYER